MAEPYRPQQDRSCIRSYYDVCFGAFFEAFCLFCFWVFLGLLSPIVALLSQAHQYSIGFCWPVTIDYIMECDRISTSWVLELIAMLLMHLWRFYRIASGYIGLAAIFRSYRYSAHREAALIVRLS
jgi:hypothetical protein